MNGFTLTKNGQNVLIALGQAPERFQSACRQGLYETGKILFSTISAGILHGPKSGLFYKYKKIMIRASAPGEFSANRSGTLRRSYDFVVDGYRQMRFGSDVKYAPYIELGTVNMGPRENIKQAIEKTEEKVLQLLSMRLDQELKRL